MTDPITFERIGEAVAAGRPDPTRDEELPLGIGSMPMSALAAFQDMSIDHDILDKPGPAPRTPNAPATPRAHHGATIARTIRATPRTTSYRSPSEMLVLG